MAIWQCDFHFVPTEWLMREYGAVPTCLSEQIRWEEPYWEGESLPPNYAEQLLKFTSQTKSWSEKLEIYGDADGNCLQILIEDGRRISPFLRIDLRQIDETFIDGILLFAQELKYLLVGAEGKIIAPERHHLRTALRESRAYRFVTDPEKYFEEIKKNPIHLRIP